MKRKNYADLLIILLLLSATQLLSAIDPGNTRLLSQPAASSTHIAFIYAEDLWIADADGSDPRRLTVDEGIESDPFFSPDGKIIAFSAQYDGNTDVYSVPVTGGVPLRLTWHPGDDLARGFTPDGKKVLFASQREVFTTRYFQLFTVSLEGGLPEKLDIPNAWSAAYSPDGTKMAYVPIPPRYQQWKNYRGGTTSNIWVYSFGDHSVVKVPQPKEGCNDADPMWVGDKVYFISDREGEFNLYSWDSNNGTVARLTDFAGFPVLKAAAGAGRIIFEQEGYLHTYEISSNSTATLTIGIAADLLELRPRFVQGSNYIRSFDISPTGARAVFDYRGEIITLPAEKGDPRNITLTPGAHEKYPSWSPDGKYIAYFSDASGEYALHIKSQDGKGEVKSFTPAGSGFYAFPEWSPDSKKICYVDNARNLYLLDISSGNISKVDADDLYQPGAFREIFGDWSSDSKWILYTRVLTTQFRSVWLYSVDQKKSFPVTDGLSDASEPVFDPDGEYIYFFASTDAGPVINWFDLSRQDMRMTNSIYLVTLRKDIISPFAKESDEETAKKAENESIEPAAKDAGKNSKKDAKTAPPAPEKKEILKIDTDGLQDRIVNIPVRAGSYTDLDVAATGEILYIVRPAVPSEPAKMFRYTLKDRKGEEVMELDGYKISADRKKMLYNKGQTYGYYSRRQETGTGKGSPQYFIHLGQNRSSG